MSENNRLKKLNNIKIKINIYILYKKNLINIKPCKKYIKFIVGRTENVDIQYLCFYELSKLKRLIITPIHTDASIIVGEKTY